jgi:hypothetical protein
MNWRRMNCEGFLRSGLWLIRGTIAGYALRVRANTRQTTFSTAGVPAKIRIGHPLDEVWAVVIAHERAIFDHPSDY